MPRYLAVIDGAAPSYTVTFPDLAGLTASGRTTDEAIDNAVGVLATYAREQRAMAGMPAPHDLTELRRRRDVRLALGKGAVLALVPLVMETGRSTHANLSIDDGLLRAIDEEARRLGVTRSAFVAAATREKIART
jgi:predicted RNase H-like HicB family nuclease